MNSRVINTPKMLSSYVEYYAYFDDNQIHSLISDYLEEDLLKIEQDSQNRYYNNFTEERINEEYGFNIMRIKNPKPDLFETNFLDPLFDEDFDGDE